MYNFTYSFFWKYIATLGQNWKVLLIFVTLWLLARWLPAQRSIPSIHEFRQLLSPRHCHYQSALAARAAGRGKQISNHINEGICWKKLAGALTHVIVNCNNNNNLIWPMDIVNNKTGDTRFHQIVGLGFEQTRFYTWFWWNFMCAVFLIFILRHYCEQLDFDLRLLEVSNNLKQRPIHIAVASKCPDLVSYLLKKGEKIHYIKNNFSTLKFSSII